ncbi:MAG TPA: hypothetical protein ENN17_00250 [bacterium]|nr:hypothetical protein [bacterium]
MKLVVRWIGFVIALLGLAFLVRSSQIHLDQMRQIRFIDRSPVFLPRGEVLKWLSMGYRGLMADWLWIRTVLYYGRRVIDEDNPYYLYEVFQGDTEQMARIRDHHAAGHGHGESYHAHHHDADHAEFDRAYLDRARAFQDTLRAALDDPPPQPPESVFLLDENLRRSLYRFKSRGLVEGVYPLIERVTTVDPRFLRPYIFGGVYVMLETGRIQESIALLEKGRRNNPDRWEMPFYLGWISWMYLGDLEKTHAYLREAVGKKGCPSYVYSLLGGLSRNLDQTQITALYLEGLYNSSTDPESRRKIGELLDVLRTDEHLRRQDAEP